MAAMRHALVLAAVLLAATGVHAQSVLNPNYQDDTALSPTTTQSGLNLIQSVDGVGTFAGRTLSSSSATGPTALLNNFADATGWSDTYATQDVDGVTVNGLANAVSISSAVTDNLMQNYIWLADTAGSTVYKIDTTLTGTNSVVGAYAARPSASHGNPVAFAVLSTGDAYVGNAFTFGLNQVGSLTMVQANSATCGGPTSTGLNVLGWTSTTTGDVLQDNGGGNITTVTGLVGSLSDNADACVKDWVDLSTIDPNAGDVSIAAVGADGDDNVYTLAVNEATRFQGYLRIYQTNSQGAQTLYQDTWVDPNKMITNNASTRQPITAQSDGPGAPGGSGLAVDKWGYLWSGGGTYIKDFGGATGRQHILIRMDTNPANAGMGIQIFPVPHETNAIAFDNNGNLLVAGADSLSLINIDPHVIGITWTNGAVGATTILTPGAAPINLVALQGSCGGDNCCAAGGYNSGITVARATGDVYVANECPTGQVLHFTNTDSTFDLAGSPIAIGPYPSGINVDATDNVWVPVLVQTGSNATENWTTQLKSIAPGNSNIVSMVADLTKPYLGGIGDMTGRFTAQPPATGQWTFVHDTNYHGYDKWDGGEARWTATNVTSFGGAYADSGLIVNAYTSDDVNAPLGSWDGPQTVGTGTWTPLTLAAGRYIQFAAAFTRGGKYAPETGPQAFGLTPLLTKFELKPRNNWPSAQCQPQYALADNPTNQADNTYGANSGGRLCGAPLTNATAVDAGSHDPDTAELDTIVPIQATGAFYSPTLYAMQSAAQPYTVSTLTVTDAHGQSNQCTEQVNIQDVHPPVWKAQYNVNNATNPLSSALSDISTLCMWPPNFKYYCWLDVTSNDNDQVIPLYDNCGGSYPIGKQVDGFICGDSDPRTQPGDCVLYQSGTGGTATYNLCIKAQRRTVYTNTARVYQANFLVTDGSAQNVAGANTFSRQIKLPPLWNFQTAGDCPRPTYNVPAGDISIYTNPARK